MIAVSAPVCRSGKIIHLTEQAAKDHAATLRMATGDQVRPYKCTGRHGCGFYHVGHRPRGPKKR